MQIKAPWNPDKSEDSTFDVTQAVVQANLWPGGLVAKSYVMQPRKCPQRVHVSGSPPMFPHLPSVSQEEQHLLITATRD